MLIKLHKPYHSEVYAAHVLSHINYYPFGMTMPGRNANASTYRHGFNGMEKDDELKGSGNSYDFGARIYDPRMGRFLSIDPYVQTFPELSPYIFASNSPVSAIDEDGKYTVFLQGAVKSGGSEKNRKRETFSNDLIRTFSSLLNKDGTIRFAEVNAASEPGLIKKGIFTFNNGFKPGLDKLTDKELLDKVVNEIIEGYKLAKANNPDEKVNLIGSSYGSVLAAQVAIELDKRGIPLASVTLTATPLSEESDLGKALTNLYTEKGVVINYLYNEDDASQGSFKSTKKEYLNKNWYKNPLKYKGHITSMYKLSRVDEVIESTLAKGTEGKEIQKEAKHVLKERKSDSDKTQ